MSWVTVGQAALLFLWLAMLTVFVTFLAVKHNYDYQEQKRAEWKDNL